MMNLPPRLGKWLDALRGPGMAGVLARGAVGNLLVSGLGALLLVGVQLLIARLAGAEEFGYFLYGITLTNVLGLAARLGIDTAQIRYVASYRVKADWSRLAGILRFGDRLTLTLGCVLGILFATTVWVLRDRLDPGLVNTLWIAAAMLPVAGGLIYLRASALQALKRVTLAPLPDGIVRPALLALLAWGTYLLWGSCSGAQAMAANFAAAVVGVAVGSILLRRYLPSEARRATPQTESRTWLRTAWPLWAVAGMRFLLNQTDILLLGILTNTTVAGIYGAASRLARLVTFGLAAANSISAPLISELHTEDDLRSLQRMVTLTSWGTTLWSVVFAGALALAAPTLLSIYGEEFRAGASVLVVLALGQIINGATGPVGYLLNMTGHERINARILAWVVIANLVLSAPAILLFGAVGAAIVTATLSGTKNLWTWWVVRQRLGVNSSIFSTSWAR